MNRRMKGIVIIFINIATIVIASPQYNYAQPNYIDNGLYEAPTSSYDNIDHTKTIVSKQFFIHSAPQEEDEIGADKIINLGPGRKHYRVVFIKTPHNNVQAGRIRVIAPTHEDKTVIYILSKKNDAPDIKADIHQYHTEPSKPDVFFIKYKTPEEATHAQRQIQAQYDSLGGTTQISDEGVAPLTSVIGALNQSPGIGNHYISPVTAGITTAYLPPSQ